MQNGPSSSTSDPHNAYTRYSSDNDDDSETEDEALQKEISRLREKYVTRSQSCFPPPSVLPDSSLECVNVTVCRLPLTDI